MDTSTRAARAIVVQRSGGRRASWRALVLAGLLTALLAAAVPAAASGTPRAVADRGAADLPRAVQPIPWNWLFYGSVDFVSSSTGWFCGYNLEAGGWTIWKSTDGGTSWRSQHHLADLRSGMSLLQLRALTNNTCWAFDDHRIFRTKSGGAKWKLIHNTGKTLRDVCFVNATRGYATAVDKKGVGYILLSTDGGASWVTIKKAGGLYQYSFRSIDFVDSQRGWVMRGPQVLRTTNGGKSWKQCAAVDLDTGWDVDFVNRSIGWVAGLLGIWRSSDGGASWTQQETGYWNVDGELQMQSPSVGWWLGAAGERRSLGASGPRFSPWIVYRTTDGGATWQRIDIPDLISFDVQGVNCWALCKNDLVPSYILRSTDRGQSWKQL